MGSVEVGCSADCWLSLSRPHIRLRVKVDRCCCCWWARDWSQSRVLCTPYGMCESALCWTPHAGSRIGVHADSY